MDYGPIRSHEELIRLSGTPGGLPIVCGTRKDGGNSIGPGQSIMAIVHKKKYRGIIMKRGKGLKKTQRRELSRCKYKIRNPALGGYELNKGKQKS